MYFIVVVEGRERERERVCLGVLARVTLVDEYPQEIVQIISNFIINIIYY